MRTSLRWLTVCLLGLVSVHFARCYVTLNGYWVPLQLYADGLAKMPFQGRMLMMFPLHWAEQNTGLIQFASRQHGALRTPDLIVTSTVALAGLVATGLLVTHMYRKLSRLQLFPWLPYTLLLLICFFNYILHVEQNFLYPYDLPGLLFFTLGVWLIYTRRFWWLLLLFPVATLNRETTIFLVPLLLLDAGYGDGQLGWAKLRRWMPWAKAVLLVAVWEAVEIYVRHRFRDNPTDLGSHVQVNLVYLTHPQYWPQLLSMGAYLPVLLFCLRREIEDVRLRIYLWIFPLWLGVMFYFGMLDETRIFGELGGLLALLCALVFERKIWALVGSRMETRTAALGPPAA